MHIYMHNISFAITSNRIIFTIIYCIIYLYNLFCRCSSTSRSNRPTQMPRVTRGGRFGAVAASAAPTSARPRRRKPVHAPAATRAPSTRFVSAPRWSRLYAHHFYEQQWFGLSQFARSDPGTSFIAGGNLTPVDSSSPPSTALLPRA